MRRKKKGSTLITVVAIFAVLFTVGTSVLALTASSYQSRVLESRRIENLYGSESGIDIAYAITGKVVEQAVRRGNYSVKIFMDTFGNTLASEKTKMKNGQTCDYPRDDDSTKSKLLNDDYTTNLDNVKTLLNDMFKTTYRNVINNYLHDKIVNKSFLTLADDSAGTPTSTPVTFNTSYEPTFDVTVYSRDDNNHEVRYDVASKFAVKIISNYQVDSTTGNQERKVEANYTINVPNYEGVFGTKTTNSNLKIHPLMQKAIAIDGDLTIRGKLNVTGAPVFVKGHNPGPDSTTSVSYSKYSGGIIVDSSVKTDSEHPSVQFGDNVVTANTLRLINNGTVKLAQDLYANNIYVGKDQNGISSSNDLNIGGQAVLDNDLAVNTSGGSIYMYDLYAISSDNRIHMSENTVDEVNSDPNLENYRSSSSIIINSSDDSTPTPITVNHKAAIMGTAYINLGTRYQTGESVAIKGNYTAYATILPSESSNGFYYSYYSPLQLIDKGDFTVNLKSKHFFDYYDYTTSYDPNNTLQKLKVPTNINLPDGDNTRSLGAYIDEGHVYKGNYVPTDETVINEKKGAYATQVYELGNLNGVNAMTSYENGVVHSYVGNQINFPSSSYNSASETVANPPDKIIINNNSANTVVLVGNGVNYTAGANETLVRADTSGHINGIIVTRGNVKMYGRLSFTGSVMAVGDMEIDRNADVTITYDTNYVQQTLKGYSDNFSNLFNANNYTSSANYESNQTVTSSTSAINAINPKKYIQKGVWKINQ